MRVISTTGNRTVKLPLRYEHTGTISYKVVITNDNLRTTNTIDVNNWSLAQYNDNNGQLAFTVTETYQEGDELTVKVTNADGSIVYHRNKIFITDKTPQNYSING